MARKKKRKKATTLIPLTFNDWTKIPMKLTREIYLELFDAFDGWTLEGHVRGAYRMASGAKQVERFARVSVALFDADLPELRRMIARWCAQLEQETMYLEVLDAEIEFIRPYREED